MRWLCALLLLSSCSYPTEPSNKYSQWYEEVEACSGLHGNFMLIHWKIESTIPGGYFGYWTPRHQIEIRQDLVDYERLVKHEMLHDLLQRGDHPAEYFNNKCGNLIDL